MFHDSACLNASVLCADCVPILMRILFAHNFQPGPFNMSRFQPYLNIVTFVWIIFSTVQARSLPLQATEWLGALFCV